MGNNDTELAMHEIGRFEHKVYAKRVSHNTEPVDVVLGLSEDERLSLFKIDARGNATAVTGHFAVHDLLDCASRICFGDQTFMTHPQSTRAMAMLAMYLVKQIRKPEIFGFVGSQNTQEVQQ